MLPYIPISSITRHLLKWTLISLPLSLVVGSLVALFLWLLQWVTLYRMAHPWLLFLLPVMGVVIYYLYRLWGKNAEAGNNLIIEEIHTPGGGVPTRMAPLIFITTLLTHLAGGSAGREGTAVQMGGSMAHLLGRLFQLSAADMQTMLMAGIAAGFGAVFGTPVAGAIFALEVLAIGTMRYNALLPCLIAATLADRVTAAWGTQHTQYSIAAIPAITGTWVHVLAADTTLLIKVIAAGAAFGLVAYLFITIAHLIKNAAKTRIKTDWLIPVAGGIIIIALRYISGTADYLGLGVTGQYNNSVSIVSAFHAGGAGYWSWLWKLIFTTITLSMGFKGGEVTPLFFIGATLGNAIAILCGAPVELFVALGFIAVFAGATNTPIACTIMGAELFGVNYIFYFAVACITAYYCSGKTGIYHTRRMLHKKATTEGPCETI
jgi:H+/Cl- antiporter ClcA